MITHASRAANSDANASFLLGKLHEAHAKLLSAIDDLARLTRGDLPDEERIVEVRWQVSEASLVRRLLWGRIHAYLAEQADADVEPVLRELQDADMQLIRASTEHVGKWSSEAVMADWPGYCRASQVMRGKLIDGVKREKRLLYPILEATESRRA